MEAKLDGYKIEHRENTKFELRQNIDILNNEEFLQEQYNKNKCKKKYLFGRFKSKMYLIIIIFNII